MMDKTFHSFRKSKTNNVANYWRWTPFNLVNIHYMRNAKHAMDSLSEQDLLYSLYKSQPDLVLNIGNEFLSL
jgi:hypothetical protein